MDESQGLVNGYVTKVRQAACRVQRGSSLDEVKSELETVIAEAHEHIAIWVNGTPENNWKHFIGQIRFASNFGGDERVSEALLLAVGLAQDLPIPCKKSK
ncbi:hypothetical protein OGY69_17520 [Citrobacter sp. Cpo086]|uniref:hypothetical protein n=1 Tax=Citrobacter sp. Cpo086 TaxID=2985137 RepID=UPI002576D1D0|nr:hypothetical protein [Citrobacter sp. Cpo086]MDM2840654.1 hypothetical protein [Citrobacter sp. Cpo086]